MMDRNSGWLCHQQEFLVFEKSLVMGGHVGFAVVFHMVNHLVASVAQRFKRRGIAVNCHQPARNFFRPFFAAVVGEPFRKAVQQKPAVLFRSDFTFKEHVLGGAHLRESLT